MIEVEKRFVNLTDDNKAALTTGAELVKNKINVDTYYDKDDYSLTSSDRWLRRRNDRFELKVPIGAGGTKTAITQVYRELETDPEIYEELGIPRTSILEEDLAKAGFKSYMTSRTSRGSYRNRDFNIDVDQSTYDGVDFTYNGVDIEIMVETEADIPTATQKILDFAGQCGLVIDTNPLGKNGIFIKNVRPDHYKALVEAGVLPQA